MSQSLDQLLVHLIFSTKKRYPFLKDIDIQKRLHNYIKAICHQLKCEAIIIGGVDDHVHILISLHKNMRLSDLIEEIKKSSSIWIKGLNISKNCLNEFYWQRGYGAFSVSQSNAEAVKLYIKNQKDHHRKINFQDELRKILMKHGVEYNEEYLWD